MRKATNVVVWLVGLALVAFVLFLLNQHWRLTKSVTCEDGPRQTIDLQDFTTSYFAYSLSLRATLNNKESLEGKLEPVVVSQLSDALQSANEYRKALVAGYNSCAITKSQYSQSLNTFQVLDNVSHQIDALTHKPQLSAPELSSLHQLINEYIQIARNHAR